MDERSKLGRYEKGNSFATLTQAPDGSVTYTWGLVGFEASGRRLIQEKEIGYYVSTLRRSGYTLTTDIPISEGSDKDRGILLDWVSGVTR